MKYDLSDAILKLRPGAGWVLRGTGYSGLEWLDESQNKPTESECNTKLTALVNDEPARLLRVERDKRLKECDWRASSDLTISNDWKTYRQALRDLPTSASPKLDSEYNLDLTSVTWPTEPS